MDVKVIGIAPHMHYIGKEMKVVARTPDGKDRADDLDQGLGLQLAGAVPVQDADVAAQGHGHRARGLLR